MKASIFAAGVLSLLTFAAAAPIAANHGTAVSAESGVVVPYAGGQKREVNG